MAEPLMPHPSDDETIAAEPGGVAPETEAREEPDLNTDGPQQPRPEIGDDGTESL